MNVNILMRIKMFKSDYETLYLQQVQHYIQIVHNALFCTIVLLSFKDM